MLGEVTLPPPATIFPLLKLVHEHFAEIRAGSAFLKYLKENVKTYISCIPHDTLEDCLSRVAFKASAETAFPFLPLDT